MRGEGADAGVLLILLHEAEREDEVRAHRGDRRRAGIGDAEDRLRGLRWHLEQHEQRHDDRGHDRPHRRAGGDEHVDDGEHEQDEDEHHPRRQAEAGEEFGHGDRDEHADVRPFEVLEELGDGEEEDEDPGDRRQSLTHELRNIGPGLDRAFAEAVDDAADAEEQSDEEGDSSEERGLSERSVAAQGRALGDDEDDDDDDCCDDGEHGQAQGLAFLVADDEVFVFGILVGFEVVALHQHEFGDDRDDDGEQDGAGDVEVPVADRGDDVVGVDDVRRGGRDAREDRVVRRRDRAGVVAGGDRGVGDDDAEDGGAAHGLEHHPAERHEDDIGRRRGDVGDRAHERNREHDESGRDAGDRDLHRRRQQTGALGQGHTHDDDHDRDQRREGLVGVERGAHGHGDAVAAEQIVHRGPVSGAGILDSRAGEGEDEAEHGEDRREDPEQPEGVRQLVADDFDDVEGADDQRQLLLLVGLRDVGGLGRFHESS